MLVTWERSVTVGVVAATAGVFWYLCTRRSSGRHSPPKRSWSHGVEVRTSLISGGGDGLFASRDFEAGEVLGEYYGRVLSLLQATKLVDRDYLMGGFGCAA